jgi:ribosomal-protein-alanine N-acetyltransferase
MTIERLRWWHISEIVRIESDLFGAEQWSPAMFWNELANGHHYVVAVENGQIVGYDNIAVRRDRQRHGIGRALLEELLGHARRLGARHTLLEVAADNGPAQKLYARYGFDVVGVRRGYYQPSNTDALVMRRDD